MSFLLLFFVPVALGVDISASDEYIPLPILASRLCSLPIELTPKGPASCRPSNNECLDMLGFKVSSNQNKLRYAYNAERDECVPLPTCYGNNNVNEFMAKNVCEATCLSDGFYSTMDVPQGITKAPPPTSWTHRGKKIRPFEPLIFLPKDIYDYNFIRAEAGPGPVAR